MNHHLPRALVAGAAVASLGLVSTAARADTIRVQSTTDTVDAGLVDDVLKPLYKQAQPGDTLAYTPTGTGKALDNARAGMGDVVITHAPSLEAQFVKDGFSAEPYGRAIFYSDYVIVGPADDPAGVLSGAPHDAVSAFEKIAAAGQAGKATFVSRGDNSGTNVEEQMIWNMTGDAVQKKTAGNANGDTTRSEPTTTLGIYPSWYRTTNKGQAANLQDADVCATSVTNPNGGCYTIVDRGTFNRLINSKTVTKLAIKSDRNTPTARGGQNLLVNPFSAYVVNPDKFSDSAKPNVAAATRFVDFLTSPGFQAAVDNYPSAADPAFHSDAFPAVAAAPPASVSAGSVVPLGATFTNRLTGGGAIGGLPVQLQASLDNVNWTNVGAPQSTNANGGVAFGPTITSTTAFRVVTPRYHQFSPYTQPIGVVAAIPAAVKPPTPTPVPNNDRTPLNVTRATLSAKKLTVHVSEAGTVKATFKRKTTRKVKGKTRTSYKTVKTVTLTATRAGTVSRTFKALKVGTYRTTLRSTDRAGNVQSRTVTLKVHATKKKSKKH